MYRAWAAAGPSPAHAAQSSAQQLAQPSSGSDDGDHSIINTKLILSTKIKHGCKELCKTDFVLIKYRSLRRML